MRLIGAVVATSWLTLAVAGVGAAATPSHAGVGEDARQLAAAGQPQITLSPDSGPPGTTVTVSGTGFPPSEIVALYMDDPSLHLDTPGPQADATGAFRRDIVTPGKSGSTAGTLDPTRVGAHEICADTGYAGNTQPVAAKVCVQFTVTAPSSPTPTPGGAAVPQPGPSSSVIGLVILVILAGGAYLWTRRRR